MELKLYITNQRYTDVKLSQEPHSFYKLFDWEISFLKALINPKKPKSHLPKE